MRLYVSYKLEKWFCRSLLQLVKNSGPEVQRKHKMRERKTIFVQQSEIIVPNDTENDIHNNYGC